MAAELSGMVQGIGGGMGAIGRFTHVTCLPVGCSGAGVAVLWLQAGGPRWVSAEVGMSQLESPTVQLTSGARPLAVGVDALPSMFALSAKPKMPADH